MKKILFCLLLCTPCAWASDSFQVVEGVFQPTAKPVAGRPAAKPVETTPKTLSGKPGTAQKTSTQSGSTFVVGPAISKPVSSVTSAPIALTSKPLTQKDLTQKPLPPLPPLPPTDPAEKTPAVSQVGPSVKQAPIKDAPLNATGNTPDSGPIPAGVLASIKKTGSSSEVPAADLGPAFTMSTTPVANTKPEIKPGEIVIGADPDKIRITVQTKDRVVVEQVVELYELGARVPVEKLTPQSFVAGCVKEEGKNKTIPGVVQSGVDLDVARVGFGVMITGEIRSQASVVKTTGACRVDRVSQQTKSVATTLRPDQLRDLILLETWIMDGKQYELLAQWVE